MNNDVPFSGTFEFQQSPPMPRQNSIVVPVVIVLGCITALIVALTWKGQGTDGVRGPEGPRGLVGPTGPIRLVSGPTGPVGPTGPSGPRGAVGPAGAAGAAGVRGATGATGPVGATGAVGPRGDGVGVVTSPLTLTQASGALAVNMGNLGGNWPFGGYLFFSNVSGGTSDLSVAQNANGTYHGITCIASGLYQITMSYGIAKVPVYAKTEPIVEDDNPPEGYYAIGLKNVTRNATEAMLWVGPAGSTAIVRLVAGNAYRFEGAFGGSVVVTYATVSGPSGPVLASTAIQATFTKIAAV